MSSATNPSRGLTVKLFGDLRIKLNGNSIPGIASNKGRALLVYLAVESKRSHRRDKLAEMLWPDREQGIARKSLKQSLANLRKVTGDREARQPFLFIERDRIRFNPDCDHCVDLHHLDQLINESRRHPHQEPERCPDCESRLMTAVAIYQGDFLKGFSIPDSQGFEEWALLHREAYRRKISRVLRRLIRLREAGEKYRDARRYARRLVNLEPWDEEAHRDLMRLFALDGRRTAALRQYQECKQILAVEFNVEPSVATERLAEQIKAGRLEGQRNAIPVRKAFKRAKPQASAKSTKRWRPLLLPVAALLAVAVVSQVKLQRSPVVSEAVAQSPKVEVLPAVSTSADELQALKAVFMATDGPNWANSDGWLSDSSHCLWYGVQCTAGSITRLILPANSLAGQIPIELRNLPELIHLELQENELTGEIPSWLGQLQNLDWIDLGFNFLEGEIPPELGQLSNLRHLRLDGNSNLSGPVPKELFRLQNLTHLVLSSFEGGNQLSGFIPPELGGMRRLMWLELANTLIEGPIPPELGNVTGLMYLDLSNNNLSGTMPPEMGNLTNLWAFQVGEGPNQLHGPVPMSFTNLRKIRVFQFHDTDICEPRDVAFHEWLRSVPEVLSTNIPCN
jgi:DNA-binding SARP family transcriptional activator